MQKILIDNPDAMDKRFVFDFFVENKTLGKAAGIAIKKMPKHSFSI